MTTPHSVMVAVPCRCGLQPEVNTTLRGYKFSLSCQCGGGQINFLARSDRQQVCIDNWNSKITGRPFLHSAQQLPNPDADPIYVPSGEYYDTDPLRRYVRARGGFVGGPWGGCS